MDLDISIRLMLMGSDIYLEIPALKYSNIIVLSVACCIDDCPMVLLYIL